MDAARFFDRLTRARDYREQIVATRTLPERAARFASPKAALPAPLVAMLRSAGIEQLYTHQAATLDALADGQDVVVCTGTASGKSLCFHLPVLAALLEDPQARALYLFPTKALANDQLASLERMILAAELGEIARPETFDGDTPAHKRPGIRRTANILLSNPDMLHVSVLPYHAKWAGLLARLRYVVVDEAHTYRGIFGSHVAGVLRRLARLCAHYGGDPRFICCSATLGNPGQLCAQLINRPVTLIDDDGAPRGRKHVVLWNPPLMERGAGGRSPSLGSGPVPGHAHGGRAAVAARRLDDGPPAQASAPGTGITRRSANVEAQELMEALLAADASVILFTKARVVAELIYRYLRDALSRRRADLANRVRPYRGGYLPNERREIEQALFSGALRGVCTTSALELGIDVGALDAAVIVGFPGTLCSFWQQAGRAGRRQAESLAVFVAYDDPVDQYLMRQADFLFDRPLEHALVDPANPHILASQLGCAAFELPLAPEDLAQFGGVAPDVARVLVEAGRMRDTGGRCYWSSAEAPASKTNLRTISDATLAIIDATDGRNEVIGQVDSISAPEQVYPEAIYLHQAESYIVRRLDLPGRTARVERFEADYFTQPLLACDIRIAAAQDEQDYRGGRRVFGAVVVRWQTTAFKKIKLYTLEMIGQTALQLPAQEIETTALWLTPPPAAMRAVAAAGFKPYEALSGVRNLLLVCLPPLAMADRYDIGGIVDSAQLGAPTIFLYDRYPGGVGYARHGYESCDRLLAMAGELLAGCRCDDGCPACVGPPNLRVPIHHDPDLSGGYQIPSKAATACLLTAWA